MKLTTRLLIMLFLSVLMPLLALTFLLKQEITASILREKEGKLFGLAKQLDGYLEGTYDDILREEGALDASRETQISVLLNRRLWAITISWHPGTKAWAGVLRPGPGRHRHLRPSDQFQYTVGQAIAPTHRAGKSWLREALVQQGFFWCGAYPELHVAYRPGRPNLGYIWSNETLDMISGQLAPILRRYTASSRAHLPAHIRQRHRVPPGPLIESTKSKRDRGPVPQADLPYPAT